MRHFRLKGILTVSLLPFFALSVAAEPPEVAQAAPTERAKRFEENVGQFDPRVRFVLKGATYQAFIQPNSVVFTWFDRTDPDPNARLDRPKWTRDGTIRMALDGARGAADVTGLGEVLSRGAYVDLARPDFAALQPRAYGRVAVREVYPGIDVEYYLQGDQVEHDFLVSPGADPSVIRLKFDGVDSIELSPTGDLLLTSGRHTLVQEAPFVYQGSREEPAVVEAAYQISDDGSVGYKLGTYNPSRRLVIDPIAWTTYAGGSAIEFPIDVDAGLFGEAKILLLSTSTDFPVTREGKLVRIGQSRIQSIIQAIDELKADIRTEEFVTVSEIADAESELLDLENLLALEEAKKRAEEQATVHPELSAEESVEGHKRQSLNPTVAERLANGASLVALAGPTQNSTSTDGTTLQGRVDGVLTVLLLGGGPPETIFQTIVGTEFNDVAISVEATETPRNGTYHLFLTGSAAGPLNLPDQPANPYQDSLDIFHIAYQMTIANGTPEFSYSSHTFVGTSDLDSPTAVNLSETDDGMCRLTTTMSSGNGVDAPQTLNVAVYDPATGRFLPASSSSALSLPGRVRDIAVDGEVVRYGGSTFTGGEVFGGSGLLDRSGGARDFRTATTGTAGADVLSAVGPSDPNDPRGVRLIWGSRDCDPAITAPGEVIPSYGTMGREGCVYVGVLPSTAGAALRSERTLSKHQGSAGVALLGGALGSGGVRFSSRPGGSYALAGGADSNVFGPVNGIAPPPPLEGLSPGPGDAFAAGGLLDAPWVVAVTRPADFTQGPVARGGIVTGFTAGLTGEGQSAFAPEVPLPNDMLGTRSRLVDSAGAEHPLGQFFINSNQLNGYIPPEAALGIARIEIEAFDGSIKVGETLIADISPNAFTFAGGIGAALTIHLDADGNRTDTNTIIEPAIQVGPGERLFFSQFVTGTANGAGFAVTCDDKPMTVLAAAPAPGLLGVEQVAFEVDTAALEGSGQVRFECRLSVDGLVSNAFGIQYDRVQ